MFIKERVAGTKQVSDTPIETMDLCWFFIIVLTILMGFLSNWTCSSYFFKCSTCEQRKRCESIFDKNKKNDGKEARANDEGPSSADADDFMGAS